MKRLLYAIMISVLLPVCLFGQGKSGFMTGRVRDTEGRPVAGAIVTDGFTHSETDQNGNFRFESPYPERVHFVSVRIPAGYRPILKNGCPVFFSSVDPYAGKERSAEIILQKRDKIDDSFTLMLMADPQAYVYSSNVKRENVAYASTDVWNDLFGDMREKIAATSGECYGICLGDIAASLRHGSVYPEYCRQLSTLNIPFYHVIGNHDHYHEIARDDDESALTYEETFGPRNYSFDIGKFHFIVLDNCIFIKGLRRYPFMYGLQDEYLEWLKSDLARVPEDMPVMICAHADFFNENGLVKLEYDGMKCDYKFDEFLDAIQGFDKLSVWAGHTHTTSFHGKVNTPANTSGVESYVVGRPTGDMPVNEYVSGDGTPRGYVVVEISGKEMTWKYRTISAKTAPFRGKEKPELNWNEYAAGETQQVHAYPRGAYGDDFVYANVYLWDQHWGTPVLKIGSKEYQMTRDHVYDLGWKEISRFYVTKNDRIPNYRGSRNSHGFMIRVPEKARGTGTVEVTDRFGRQWTTEVSVAPVRHDDGLKHLVFDFSKGADGCPEKVSEDVRFRIKKHDFQLSRGCYIPGEIIEDNHICLSGRGSSIVLPAIKGQVLTGVTVHPSGNRMKQQTAQITDMSGNTIQGGKELVFYGNVTDSWNVTGTEPGTSYRIVSTSETFRIGEIRLTYRKIR